MYPSQLPDATFVHVSPFSFTMAIPFAPSVPTSSPSTLAVARILTSSVTVVRHFPSNCGYLQVSSAAPVSAFSVAASVVFLLSGTLFDVFFVSVFAVSVLTVSKKHPSVCFHLRLKPFQAEQILHICQALMRVRSLNHHICYLL